MPTKTLKSPAEFADIREWRAYVRANAPADEISYLLAHGRTELFLRFYEIRAVPFPEAFRSLLK